MGIGRTGRDARPWRIRIAAALALLALLLAACGGAGASGGGGGSSTSGDYTALERRPFHAPALDASGGCPVSTQRQVTPDTGGTGGALTAVGDGPAYVTGKALVVIGVAFGGGGGGQHGGKTPPPHTSSSVRQVWLIAPYDGPILVRARRIDGDGAVRFGVGQNGVGGVSELRLAGGGNHWISSSTDFVADSAGCYAFQVDGNGFSYPVVFLFVYTRD